MRNIEREGEKIERVRVGGGESMCTREQVREGESEKKKRGRELMKEKSDREKER